MKLRKNRSNKTLHLTAIPLRSIAAGELGRWVLGENFMLDSILGMMYGNTRR